MSHGLVKWLLRLYPKDFRESHGDDLLRTYAEVIGDSGRSSWRARLRGVLDLIVGAIGVHSDRLRYARPGAPAGGGPRHEDTGMNRRGKWNMTGNLVSEIKYALRGLSKAPGFTIMAVLTIALGLGANTAIFSVVNGVLLEPLPYQDSEELVKVYSRFLPESGFDFPQFAVDPTEYMDFRDINRSMDQVVAYTGAAYTITGPEGDAVQTTSWVTTWKPLRAPGQRARDGSSADRGR
jgi:hypothetical protein